MRAPSPLVLHFLRRAAGPRSSTSLRSTQLRAQSSSGASKSTSQPSSKSASPPPQSNYHSPLPTLYSRASRAPQTSDRGPPSTESTQTDFAALDIHGSTPQPTNSIEACLDDGFLLDNGLAIRGGAGVLLLNGEAFVWRPWTPAHGAVSLDGGTRGAMGSMLDAKGRWSVPDHVWGALEVVWPRPELLVLGVGRGNLLVGPDTRAYLTGLGVRVELGDTRNAAAMFNLLAAERGVGSVAAALVPVGWRAR